jgi:superfamily I DNA and/or RNA helicase
LKDSPVEINFNQENFIDALHDYKEYTKTEFEAGHEEGMLKLFPEAVLGVFPQAGSYLVPDYLHLIEEDRYQDIEDFIASRMRPEDRQQGRHSPEYFYFLNKVKEEETFTPFKIDAYQENALKAVKRGNSLVVVGPPGTGKSQLICNLISDFTARGKNVLLVCQKRAALDVVYDRLKEIGLSDFAALVHDFKNDRKVIYRQIHEQIEKLYEYKIKNNTLDAIQLERTFLQASHKIDHITEEFEEFKSALFDDQEAGISIKELYLTSDHLKPSLNLKQEYRYLTFDKLPEFVDKLQAYYEYHQKYASEDYIWRVRKNFAGYGITDLKNMRDILQDIPDFSKKLTEKTKSLLGSEVGVLAGEKIFEGRDQLREMLEYLEDQTVYAYFKHMINTREAISDSFPDTLWLSTAQNKLMGCFDAPGPEISLKADELGEFQKVLKSRLDARRNIVKLGKWLFASKQRMWIKKVLARNKLRNSAKRYRILERKVDFRLNYEHNMTSLRATKWLVDFPEAFSQKKIRTWFEKQQKAVSAFLIFDSFRNFKEYFSDLNIDLETFKERVTKLIEYLHEVPGATLRWRTYLLDSRIETLLNDHAMSAEMRKVLDADFDALCDFDTLTGTLAAHELRIVEKILEVQELADEVGMMELFMNSLRLAWIDHIETKYPILRAVNSLRFERMQRELQESVKAKLRTSHEIALLKSRERTYQDVEFNRLNNMVTYRDLSHQVTKKRQIWPIRKLISNYGSEVFNLLPCWMASPESVSAIFPMEQLFDLVIFDEASQCFAERGIPAMYRGRQTVITGDPMQLSPFDLYNTRWESEEDNGEIALEVDSLLDLASTYMMKVQLRGHYRSKSLELIDFSNQYFYNGKLQLLPDRDLINRKEPAITFKKVKGVWERNINEVEAAEVVRLTLDLLKRKSDLEIGIVTFNARQQDYVMELLETEAAAKRLGIPDSLIVKNIENIQGDEKDIIIFSIGYAPDKSGRLKHRFGSLNITKGENRLNVAVTRAREKIYLISSVMPDQLKTGDTKNEGPKLLKKYLQYALEVSEGRYIPTMPGMKKHNIDWYLKNKIRSMFEKENEGFLMDEELPFADLTIKHKGKYLGLILTDDDLYHDSVSIKDPHIYKPFILSGKNWKFRGIYSRDYWHDKSLVKERLARFIQLID